MKLKIKKSDELLPYQGYYSENKLWSKLSRIASRIGRSAAYYVLILYYLLISPNVSIKNKAVICGALGYLILPADLLPDVIPLLGLTDDIAAIKLAYDTVRVSVTPEIESQAESKLEQWFKSE